jgi:hypothetical protein
MKTKKPTLATTGYFRTELTFPMSDDSLYIISGQLETPDQKALFHKLAAVDDLIEALSACADWLDWLDDPRSGLGSGHKTHIKQARAALAKARGEV